MKMGFAQMVQAFAKEFGSECFTIGNSTGMLIRLRVGERIYAQVRVSKSFWKYGQNVHASNDTEIRNLFFDIIPNFFWNDFIPEW